MMTAFMLGVAGDVAIWCRSSVGSAVNSAVDSAVGCAAAASSSSRGAAAAGLEAVPPRRRQGVLSQRGDAEDAVGAASDGGLAGWADG